MRPLLAGALIEFRTTLWIVKPRYFNSGELGYTDKQGRMSG